MSFLWQPLSASPKTVASTTTNPRVTRQATKKVTSQNTGNVSPKNTNMGSQKEGLIKILQNAVDETCTAVGEHMKAKPSKKSKPFSDIYSLTKEKTSREVIDEMAENVSLASKKTVTSLIDEEGHSILSLFGNELDALKTSISKELQKIQEKINEAHTACDWTKNLKIDFI